MNIPICYLPQLHLMPQPFQQSNYMLDPFSDLLQALLLFKLAAEREVSFLYYSIPGSFAMIVLDLLVELPVPEIQEVLLLQEVWQAILLVVELMVLG